MKKSESIIIRVDPSTKEEFASIVEQNGYNVSQVLYAAISDINRRGKIPISYHAFLPSKNEKSINIAVIRRYLHEFLKENDFGEKIEKAYLFGSYSRGEETNQSDIDLYLETTSDFSLSDLALLREQMENKTHKDVDIISGNNLAPEFYETLKRDRICLYERER